MRPAVLKQPGPNVEVVGPSKWCSFLAVEKPAAVAFSIVGHGLVYEVGMV